MKLVPPPPPDPPKPARALVAGCGDHFGLTIYLDLAYPDELYGNDAPGEFTRNQEPVWKALRDTADELAKHVETVMRARLEAAVKELL